MKLRLRDYQKAAILALPGLLNMHNRVVAVAPTSSGKTVIGSELASKLPGARALWLAHRVELLQQAHDSLIDAGVPAKDVGILSGTVTANETARILVASVDMFRSRPVPEVDLFVVDEAHRAAAASYRNIIDVHKEAFVLGLTATPWRLDGSPLGDVFKHLHTITTQTELIGEGFIAQPVTYGVPKYKAKALVSGMSAGKDYNNKQLGKAMTSKMLLGDIVSEWQRLARGRRTIVFAVNREHARALLRRFRAIELRSEYLDGETPANVRKAMLSRLRTGETRIVVNVDVLSEGFDCPEVKCVVLARPTKSLTRFLQQVGRATRIHGESRPVIIDHAGNCWRFGLPEAERDWSLAGRKKGDGEAKLKCCPSCSALVPSGLRVCSECGATLLTQAEIEEQKAELERLKALRQDMERARERLTVLAKEKDAPRGWVERVMVEMFRGAA